jgi:hypothetical protein
MDPDRLNIWKRMRAKFTGQNRALAIPAVIAATLFYGKKRPATEPAPERDTRKGSDDSERTDQDAAA